MEISRSSDVYSPRSRGDTEKTRDQKAFSVPPRLRGKNHIFVRCQSYRPITTDTPAGPTSNLSMR